MKSENSPALLKEASWRLITAGSPFLQINKTPAGSMSLANEPWIASSGKLTGLRKPSTVPFGCDDNHASGRAAGIHLPGSGKGETPSPSSVCLCSGRFPAPASLGFLAGKFPLLDSAGIHLVGLSFLAAKSSMKDGQPKRKNRPSSGFDKHLGSGDQRL